MLIACQVARTRHIETFQNLLSNFFYLDRLLFQIDSHPKSELFCDPAEPIHYFPTSSFDIGVYCLSIQTSTTVVFHSFICRHSDFSRRNGRRSRPVPKTLPLQAKLQVRSLPPPPELWIIRSPLSQHSRLSRKLKLRSQTPSRKRVPLSRTSNNQ